MNHADAQKDECEYDLLQKPYDLSSVEPFCEAMAKSDGLQLYKKYLLNVSFQGKHNKQHAPN
jgi:hypothetical protein